MDEVLIFESVESLNGWEEALYVGTRLLLS